MSFIMIVIVGLMLATLLVLLLVIVNMTRSSEKARRTSNKLMVLRVSLQAAVIALIGLMFLVGK